MEEKSGIGVENPKAMWLVKFSCMTSASWHPCVELRRSNTNGPRRKYEIKVSNDCDATVDVVKIV